MTRKRHTEEQIIAVLKDAQAGIGVPELCRKHGISDATFYKWRTKYAGLEVSDVKKLRQLEDENRRLKQMVAEQALDLQALKAVTTKNWQRPRRSERPPSGWPSALGSVSDACAGYSPSIGTRCGIAVDGRRMRRYGRGFGTLRSASGAMGVPGFMSGCDGKAGG